MSPMPAGTVTFLFTDIEGSTRLWQQSPAAMGPALARHHELIRRSVETHQGHLFQIVGDGCCAAFALASEAALAALQAQRDLATEPWGAVGELRVRMALHTGPAELRPGDVVSGEYVSGVTLSRVARILAACHGEQVLLSHPTAELLREGLPVGVALRDLGRHQLRDITQPQRLFQLVAAGLRERFPPSPALAEVRHNLPPQVTSFVGRQPERAALCDALDCCRLVTLIGPGGSGKTRLSLEVAGSLVDKFADGVWFVELAAVTDPALLDTAVLHCLGLREGGGGEPGAILLHYLEHKSLLMVLDNCEHLVAAVAALVHRLLDRCQHLQLLTTTREPLGIAGEQVWPVPPLALPASPLTAAQDAAALTRFESVRLFIDRARTAQPAFTVDNHNAPAVAEICIRLDGLPLAIELAAARIKILGPQQILERLSDRFRLLTGGSRTALPRQQTLRAAIDWSFDLLPPPEQGLLRRLSVFAGGFTLPAAEFVAADESDADELIVLESLTQLVNKSLVATRPMDRVGRYSLLESVRQYGQDKLALAGELETSRDRHAQYFTRLAEAIEPRLTTADQVAALSELEADWANMRAALEWAVETGDAALGLRLAARLGRYWAMRGDFNEGRLWLRRMIELDAAPGLPDDLGWALYYEGYLAWFQADIEFAGASLRRAQELAVACGNRRCEAYAVDFVAVVAMASQEFELAFQGFQRALDLMNGMADRWGTAFVLGHMGNHAYLRGNHAGGMSGFERALQLTRSLGDRFRSGILLRYISLERLRIGDSEQALEWLRQALEIAVERRGKFEIANALWIYGEALDLLAMPKESERLRLAAADVYDTVGTLRTAGSIIMEAQRARAWFAERREQFDQAKAEGRIPSMDEAVEWALHFQLPGSSGP